MWGLNDVLPQIARHANIETRMRMACVCRKWYTLVNANPLVWQDLIDTCRDNYSEHVEESEALHHIKKLPALVRSLMAYRDTTCDQSPPGEPQRTFLASPRVIDKTEPVLSDFVCRLLSKRWSYSPSLICARGAIYDIVYYGEKEYYAKTMTINKALRILDRRCHLKLL